MRTIRWFSVPMHAIPVAVVLVSLGSARAAAFSCIGVSLNLSSCLWHFKYMRMSPRARACMRACVCVCVPAFAYVYVHVRMRACMRACARVCVRACVACMCYGHFTAEFFAPLTPAMHQCITGNLNCSLLFRHAQPIAVLQFSGVRFCKNMQPSHYLLPFMRL